MPAQEQASETFTSTAEGGVDHLIHDRFFADSSERGTFVDVGAARPDYLSVNALYRNLGWDVVAVEPNPEFAKLWKALDLEVFEYACGEHDEDNVDFSVVDSQGQAYPGGTISYESFSSLKIRDNYRALKNDLIEQKIKVNLRRLDTILELHRPQLEHIDILSVDTEGWELEVLNGLSFERYKPSVLVIENLLDEPGYRRYMRQKGYAVWRSIYPNEVYVRRDLLKPVERLVLVPARNFVRHVRRAMQKKNSAKMASV